MRKEKLEGFGERIRAQMGKRSITDLSKQIEKSYEMTRRYVNGWAIPDDPAVLDRIASALNTTVGNLVSGEQDNTKLPPLVSAADLTQPTTETIRLIIEDEAMFMTVENIRLFALGDQVVVTPKRHLPGDIVAIKGKAGATLRRYTEADGKATFQPKGAHYGSVSNATVLGVVTGVYGSCTR